MILTLKIKKRRPKGHSSLITYETLILERDEINDTVFKENRCRYRLNHTGQILKYFIESKNLFPKRFYILSNINFSRSSWMKYSSYLISSLTHL